MPPCLNTIIPNIQLMDIIIFSTSNNTFLSSFAIQHICPLLRRLLNICSLFGQQGLSVSALDRHLYWETIAACPTEDGLVATLEGLVEMIGHFLWSSLLIDSQLSSLVHRSADGKTTKHHFTSLDYACIWKPHP